MKKAYVISRYREEDPDKVEFNKKVARHFCRQIVEEGDMPVAPHLFYTQFLDESDPIERDAGLEYGLVDLSTCNEYLIVIIDGVISEGMAGELSEAGRLGMRGRIVSMTMPEICELLK